MKLQCNFLPFLSPLPPSLSKPHVTSLQLLCNSSLHYSVTLAMHVCNFSATPALNYYMILVTLAMHVSSLAICMRDLHLNSTAPKLHTGKMATNNKSHDSSKASKWFSNKSLLHRLRRAKQGSPATSRSSSGRANGFREAFRRFDVDGDGRISSQELQSFLEWAGEEVSAEAAEGVMRDFDADGDGFMDYEDFMRLMEEKHGGNGGGEEEEEDLRRAFEMFEVEKGAGYITPGGLQRMLSRLGEKRTQEECAAMIGAYDLDGNGVLDYHEFHHMMS